MSTGKPDFNLNSYGVKYLSKEEVQEFLNKRSGLNVSSSNQTIPEDAKEKKIMSKIKPKGKTPIKQAQPKVDKLGKKIPESVTQEGTSTTPSPSITPKDGVFDNVPQTQQDMVTQEGGSSHYKKEPKMPKKELGGRGRASQQARMDLSESKQNPVLPKNASDIITEMNIMKLNLMKKDDPCWEGYEAIGMKDKDGKQVPNCVPKGDKKKAEEEKKPLNKPMRDDGNKKFKVYVRDPSTGNIVTVRFGDPNMEIKRDSPERRSSFRARHKCSEQKDITSAAYWSCKMWEKTSSVSDNIGKSADETIFKAISLKLDLTKQNNFQEQSTQARVGDMKHLKDVKHPEGLKIREASTIDHRVGNTAPLEREDTSIKQPKQTGKRGTPKVDPRMRKKDPDSTLPN